MYWKFICGWNTEKECFIRRLFGNDQEKGDINQGDTLFLHNYQGDYLYGPFTAESESEWGINPDAWDGDFQWQVRVSWNQPVYALNISFATDPRYVESVSIEGRFQKFEDSAGSDLESVLRNHDQSQKIISHS